MPALSRRGALAAAAAVLAAPHAARAQPVGGSAERPLRIIVPYNPGGITDVMSRATAVGLQQALGQPVVVENRPGANGTVGTLAAARAPADGATLTMAITDTFAINQATFRNLPYDQEKDFVPVTMVARVPFALMVGTHQRGIASFGQLVEEARKEKGRFSFASWGWAAAATWRWNTSPRPSNSRSCTFPSPARRRACRPWPAARWTAWSCRSAGRKAWRGTPGSASSASPRRAGWTWCRTSRPWRNSACRCRPGSGSRS